MEKINYFLHRNNKSGEITYLEYDKLDGYHITPKTKIEDAIRVNKIVFVNPSLSEKLIKKKIEIKMRKFLRVLENIDEDDSDNEGTIRDTLMKAERLKLNILTNYVKYLGNTYHSLTVRKIQVIINQLRMKLYNCVNNKINTVMNDNLYYLEEDEYRGRKR